ncbi:MAG: translation elongation factor Ts [Candidatus Moraniibacteriota bacterium]|jgi:elongation factor Ts
MATLEQIKKIREMLGSGIVDTKKALDEADGDETKAIEILRQKGLLKAAKKSDREASEGVVSAYVHPNGRIGVILKLQCESDFVARNEEFVGLARDIAMHIAAMSPKDGAELLSQAFVKNPEQSIEGLLGEKIAKIGENIRIGEFFRVEV